MVYHKKTFLLAAIAFLLLSGLVAGGYYLWDRNPSQNQEIPESQVAAENAIVIEKRMGEMVELATIKFKVINVEETQIISVKYGTPKVAKEETKFVVINLEITNITGAPFYFLNDSFGILDNKERLFAEYQDTFSIDNYLSGRTLSPDIKERGVFVYEIPQDAESYSLTIGKLGTSEVYKVSLSQTEPITKITEEVETEPLDPEPAPPPPRPATPTRIEGLASIRLTTGIWENWDADAEKDGPTIMIEYLDKNSEHVFPFLDDSYLQIPISADVKVMGGKSPIYRDKLIFSGHFSSDQMIKGLLGGHKIRIPKEQLNYDPAVDSPTAFIEVTVHTPEQGDFSATDESYFLRD